MDPNSNFESVGQDLTSAIFLLSHLIRQNVKHNNNHAWIISEKTEKNGLFNVKRQYFQILTSDPWNRFKQITSNLDDFTKAKGISSLKITSSSLSYKEEADTIILSLESQETLEAITSELGEILNKYKNEIMNYIKQINDFSTMAVKSMRDFATKAGLDLTAIPLDDIRPEKTEFQGIQELVQFEVDFAASGTMIIYPNPLEMTNDHLAHIMGNKERSPFALQDKILSNNDQILLQYKYYFFIYLFHEIFHCYQTLMKHGDPNKGWSFEHDASFISSILMMDSAKSDSVYFKPGVTEETMLFLADEGIHTHNALLEQKSEYIDGYLKWRNSFGYEAPVDADSFSFENNRVLDYFKIRITTEAFIEYYNLKLINNEEKFLSQAIENCFSHDKKNSFPSKQSILNSTSHFSSTL